MCGENWCHHDPTSDLRVERRRSGLSLIEMLVAISITSMLIALLMPAVHSSRESARRMQCASNLKQIGVSLFNYESTYGCLPTGYWHKYDLLPYLEQSDLAAIMKSEFAAPTGGVPTFISRVIPIYTCPSDSAPKVIGDSVTRVGTTNYVACSGTGIQRDGFNGMFNLGWDYNDMRGGNVRLSDVTDGLSNTLAMSEALHATVTVNDSCHERLRAVWELPTRLTGPTELDQFADACEALPPYPAQFGYIGRIHKGVPWYVGDSGAGMYNHVLTPNRPSCTNGGAVQYGCFTATSGHITGVNVLYGDGRVSFISTSVDRSVWRDMGSRY